MDDVRFFAVFPERALGEDIVRGTGDASIGMAVADQYDGEGSSRIDRPRHGALADSALHRASRVRVREREIETAAPKSKLVRVDRYRNPVILHRMPDGIVEAIADDGEIG